MPILSESSKISIRIALFLGTLFLISLIVLLVFYYSGSLEQAGSFQREVGKTLLHVIAVAVFGTIGSLLLADFNRKRDIDQKERDRDRDARDKQKENDRITQEREKELERRRDENNDQLRKEILGKANDIYSNTKKARRLLRARGFSSPFCHEWRGDTPLLLHEYDKYMEAINNSQLALELIAKDVETNEQAFSDCGKIIAYIRPMEKYLNRIVTEYERRRAEFQGAPPSLPIEQLKAMQDMLGPSANGRFQIDFVSNHKLLMAAIRRDLLTFSKPNA